MEDSAGSWQEDSFAMYFESFSSFARMKESLRNPCSVFDVLPQDTGNRQTRVGEDLGTMSGEMMCFVIIAEGMDAIGEVED